MSLTSLCNDISAIMRGKKTTAATSDAIRVGTVSGSSVMVDGEYKRMEVAVDIDVDDGDEVYVILSESGSTAVVVGK